MRLIYILALIKFSAVFISYHRIRQTSEIHFVLLNSTYFDGMRREDWFLLTLNAVEHVKASQQQKQQQQQQ